MKKLVFLLLTVIFTVASCTNQSVNEENDKNGIQLANKKGDKRPGTQSSTDG